MSVIWSGITEEGAVVPVQVEESGKVVAQGYPGEKGDKGDPGEEGPKGPPGEYSKGDDVELNNAYFTGDVGIGTDSPGNSLTIVHTTPRIELIDTDTDARFLLDANSSTGSVFFRADEDNALDGSVMSFSVDGGAKARILSNGNFGIGLTLPQAKLDVEGDLILKSRNKKWMIVEQSGLAHLVEQSVFLELNPHLAVDPDDPDAAAYLDSAAGLDPVETVYPKLRDIPGELTLVEQALSEVFEKLRMLPPAGWPVWDGQSEATMGNDNA